MIIQWSEYAIDDFEQNLLFLSEQVAENFTSETKRVIDIIKESPETFQKYYQNIHFVPITKHITLFYKIQKNKIELIRFWNNYKKPVTIR